MSAAIATLKIADPHPHLAKRAGEALRAAFPGHKVNTVESDRNRYKMDVFGQSGPEIVQAEAMVTSDGEMLYVSRLDVALSEQGKGHHVRALSALAGAAREMGFAELGFYVDDDWGLAEAVTLPVDALNPKILGDVVLDRLIGLDKAIWGDTLQAFAGAAARIANGDTLPVLRELSQSTIRAPSGQFVPLHYPLVTQTPVTGIWHLRPGK